MASLQVGRAQKWLPGTPSYPHKDPIFGLDLFLAYKKTFEERRFLEINWQFFQKYDKTFQAIRLGGRVIKTMDPEITKYVHATYFDHFGVEKVRSGAEYLWGDGITVCRGREMGDSTEVNQAFFRCRPHRKFGEPKSCETC